ncbi:hypothetical protein MCEMSEM23_01089 [Rhabdaerophilaceae bacterium]
MLVTKIDGFSAKFLPISAALVATLALGIVSVSSSSAEAQWRGKGFRGGPAPGFRAAPGPRFHAGPGYRGVHPGYRRGPGPGVIAGAAGAAILGGALLAPRAYGQPYYAPAYGGPAYIDEPECYLVNRRVWSERRGRYVTVRREVCD